MKLDNFSFSGHQGCPLWYKTRIKEGWTTRFKSAALGFGGTLHEGLATWYKTRDPDAVIASIESHWTDGPVDDFRDLMKCKKVMLEYMNHYVHEPFSIIPGMVEVATALPTGMYLPLCLKCMMDNRIQDGWNQWTDTCDNCGEPLEAIEYGGIFDTLVDFNGQVYILEHKTTTQMGSTFFNQFKPNNQVTGYVWLAKELSGRCDGALINAIGLYKASPTRFERHISTRSEFELDEWKQDLWTEACNIQQHEVFGHFPMRTKACTLYGACEFYSVHTVNDPAVRQRLLEQDYVKSTWEFEKRDLAGKDK